ncbi:MAG: GDSL-type esterase/lipase family protein, partial [Lentisphaeraceae bacterium]|nr:GDSL-type esterase/lipase family protein [Lentisphaeraceae bacterium]
MKNLLCMVVFSLFSTSLFAGNGLLKDGDTVVLLGGTLIERDAHESYIETALTLANAGENIKFRNLGWSGDTVKGESRGYFNPNGYKDLLTKVAEAKPTVIILAYGANAAWDGQEGLAAFEADYKKLIDDLQKQTQARFILWTPIKHEKLSAPYPDPAEFNKKAALYSKTIEKIASEKKIPLVDLYNKFSLEDKKQLTTNSVHLNEYGYRKLSHVIAKEFGYVPVAETKTEVDGAANKSFSISHNPLTLENKTVKIKGLKEGKYTIESNGIKLATADAKSLAAGIEVEDAQTAYLRKKIVEKNELYFHAWRPQNTTYLFFFRKHEQGQNAKDVPAILRHHAEREQELFELKKAKTSDYKIVPASEKPIVPVAKTSKKELILKPEDEIKTFKLPEDLEVSLFASEPMVINPTNMNWDREGRLWVCCSPNYPQIVPGHLANDYIVVLEDTDKDGKADKRTVFVDGLLIPTAVIPGDGGVYVANSTEFIHYKDTDGDGKADEKKVILSGFGTEDTHHILHTPRWGQDGLLYLNQSIYIHSHVETPYGVKRLMAGGIWQYDPHTEKLEILSYGLINSWGHQMDKWGQSFATDGAGGEGINYVFPEVAQRTAYGTKHILPGMNPGQPKHCGFEIITGTHFPEKYQGLFLANDFRGHRTNVFKVSDSGSAYTSKQQPDLIGTAHVGIDRSGKGGGFRPIDVKMGPDGAVYLADWSNIIIQHGEVDFRDERRDQVHGRIWRITAKDRKLDTFPKISGKPVSELLEMLKSPKRFVIDMAKRELIERGAEKLLPELTKWTAGLAKNEEGDYLRLQSLWLQQAVNVCNEKLLNEMLKNSNGKIRAAAVRVLRHFHDRVANTDDLLKAAVQDSHPRVRLEAVSALRVRKSTKATEIAVLALDKEMDSVLDYSLVLTLQTLKPYWVGKTSFDGNISHITYAVKATKSTEAL